MFALGTFVDSKKTVVSLLTTNCVTLHSCQYIHMVYHTFLGRFSTSSYCLPLNSAFKLFKIHIFVEVTLLLLLFICS